MNAVDRLHKMFSQIDHEIDITHTHGRTALKESANLRQDWLDKVNMPFFNTLSNHISYTYTTLMSVAYEQIFCRLESLIFIKLKVQLIILKSWTTVECSPFKYELGT